MKKSKKALASLAIAGMALSMVPFNAFADDTTAAQVSTRLAGTTAVQTAQAISKDYLTSSQYAVLAPANPYNMVDALAAAPLAAALKAPVLLTDGTKLSPEVSSEITRLGVKTVYVASGLAVIKAGVIAELQGMGVNVVSLGGYDQYETSVNIAKVIANVNPTSEIFIANGEAAKVAQDALSVASIAGADKQPLLLTQKGQLPQVVADYINSIKANITASYITGGTGVISDNVKAELPGTVTRNAGFDAYDTNLQVLENFPKLKFDRVFVANGQTMIDALAGAPLAASENAPIVLVNGSLKSTTADFLKTKVSSNTVVTALGGEAVVPEALRTAIATGNGSINVTTVAGTTDNVYQDKGDQKLAFQVNGTDKTVSEMVAAGYTVQFQATEPVFLGSDDQSNDGILANGLTDYTDFYYVVNILKGDTVVASSDSKHVNIKLKEDSSSAIDTTKVYLQQYNDGTDTDNMVKVVSGKITTDDTALLQVKGTKADNTYGVVTADMTYSSSDPSIAYVDKTITDYDSGNYAVIKTGGNTGAVTLTIKSTDGTTKTLNLTVADEKRKASASQSKIDSTTVKLDNGATQQDGVTLLDQFGDPIKGEALTVTNPADGDGDLATVSVDGFDSSEDTWAGDGSGSGTTDKKGRAIIRIDADQENTGTGTFKIKDKDSNTLKSVSYTDYATNSVSKYQLDVAPFKTSTLDASDSDDKITFLELNKYDSNGGKIDAADISDISLPGDENTNATYTVKVDGDTAKNDYLEFAVDNNRLKITSGKKTKTSAVNVAIYESGVKRASVNITPDDLRVDLTGVTFESSRPSIGSTDPYDLSDFIKESDIKTSDGSPVYFEASGNNTIYVEGIDSTILGEIKAAVTSGDMDVTLDQADISSTPHISVQPNDSHVDGKLVLTLNKLRGGVDVKAANQTFNSARDGEVDIPGTSTYVGSITINVTDVSQ